MPRLGTGECYGEKCFLEMRPLWGNTAYAAGRRGFRWHMFKPARAAPF